MDFYRIREKITSKGRIEIYPEFLIIRSRDIMIQAKTFVGIWDVEKGLWSTDEHDVARIIDADLDRYLEENAQRFDGNAYIKHLRDFSSGSWVVYRSWVSKMPDNAHPLNQELTFADTPVHRESYASLRLPYSLDKAFPKSWDKLIGTLYSPEERAKIEWAIGAVVSGDSKHIQKFLVLYGDKGTGKSTILDIIQKLFKGYYTVFEAKALGQSSNQFATESFKNSPLVAVQHDGDLSRIEDNTRLNSIISHEEMVINEKNKPLYNAAVNAFLFMGTNSPVRISDAKSGIIRRLIDATPTGNRFDIKEYELLVADINSTLGSVANHCLDVYRSMGKNYYKDYAPMNMIQKTDVFYNFIEHSSLELIANDPITLKRAWDMYREYVDETRLDWSLPQYKFREALKDYYEDFIEDRVYVDGVRARNVFKGFKKERLHNGEATPEPEKPYSLTMDSPVSLLDSILAEMPAQYSNERGTPSSKWDDVTTHLKDLDTSREHYVRIDDPRHIVIDFDIRDESGAKSKEANIKAASEWPATYSEFSKSGEGVHLHYFYDGDTSELSSVYSPNVEVKVFSGKSSLRRRVSLCNDVPIATLSKPMPKKDIKMINVSNIHDESHIRRLVAKNLRKEVHPATKPSIDFIKVILDEAYAKGIQYDISDMKPAIMAFATQSTNQANACIKAFSEMKFTGPGMEPDEAMQNDIAFDTVDCEQNIVFFDVEVYPNLFVVCWKRRGTDIVQKWINPTPQHMESLVEWPLVGFNNRKYDNHIIYARYLGADNQRLFETSMQIVNGDHDAMFANAYGLSYTDIYDFAATKKSLKKWEIDLGIHHSEMDIPWDKPVDEKDIDRVVEYCANDVNATEKLFEHLKADWQARKILAEIAGMTPNSTTNALTQQIIFGKDRNPPFVHTDLSKEFPGYTHSFGKSMYRGEVTGEGGYVYAEPGIYENVALLDVASMHPASLIALNCFGDYTARFKDLRDARVAVKHGDKKAAAKLLGGVLLPYFSDNSETMGALAFALKIAINSVYGLTSAKFPTRCNGMDPTNNIDNIVAKRGALFMVDLKHLIQERGFTVAHIKTDSVKIPNATPEIIQEVMEFGRQYGYEFEHEATYEKMCLVNDAVYIAKDADGWHATGAQFQHPVVFKTLFSNEGVTLEDYFETKAVTTALYIDWGDGRREFVGRVGKFAPVKSDGGALVREKDGKYYAATGSKGHIWNLAERCESIDQIDTSYSTRLVDEARAAIAQYGDVEAFIS